MMQVAMTGPEVAQSTTSGQQRQQAGVGWGARWFLFTRDPAGEKCSKKVIQDASKGWDLDSSKVRSFRISSIQLGKFAPVQDYLDRLDSRMHLQVEPWNLKPLLDHKSSWRESPLDSFKIAWISLTVATRKWKRISFGCIILILDLYWKTYWPVTGAC